MSLMKNMTVLWKKYTKEHSYSSPILNKYKRTCSLLFLLVFCLKCDAQCHDLELQRNFDPERFFTGSWYETHRLNMTLTKWGRCLKIDSSMVPGKVHFTTSVYVPFLFRRQSFVSSTNFDGQNKAHFLMNISILSWNVSIISTNYEDYALAYSCSTSRPSRSIAVPLSDLIFIFRRKKTHTHHVKELVDAVEKSRISYNDFFTQNC